MSSLCRKSLFLLWAVIVTCNTVEAAEPRILRVCADPNNLPFSSQSQPGLENRLVALVAAELGATVEYTWWSERKSFLRNSLNAGRCDAVMGVPSTLDTVAVTKPYYRSTYVTVARADRHLNLHSLLDDALDNCRIGIHVTGDDYAPPAQILARRGLSANITGYPLFGPDNEANPPFKLLDAVQNGEIDVAIVWGPFGGYFAQHSQHALEIHPVSPASYFGTPFTYDISVGVRKDDTALRDEIDRALERKRDQVKLLLEEFGIPLVSEVGR